MITIIIPTTRPQMLERCVAAIRENAGIDPDQYEIWAKADTERIGCPAMVSQMTEQAKGDLVCFVGDDCIPQPDFLKNALRAMTDFPDGFGVVAFNNLFNGKTKSRMAGHFLADKRMLPLLDGEFFHAGYRHSFCDNELSERAAELGRFLWVEDARIENPHPMFDKSVPSDEIYERAYNAENYKHDYKLFLKRRIDRTEFKLAIGLPLGGRTCDNQFWLSFIQMKKPNFTLLAPSIEIYEFGADIAAIRNDIVMQALEEGCTHLLFLDTDQVYQPDTVEKLLSHGKDIVASPVHRRYPPFNLILLRGELGSYERVPGKEAYSGDLIPIDATGTGCLLINTKVFFELDDPWFRLEKSEAGKVVGEDIRFCSEARAAGFEIWADTSIQTGHLATINVNRALSDIFKAIGSANQKQKEGKTCQNQAETVP